jgi:predicted amidophosphoribosyltransferase
LKVSLKQIYGPWAEGWVLDKHMIKSTYLGEDAQGHAQFDSERTEVGEATYQLKYNKKDFGQAKPLAQALADNVYPKLKSVGFIVPMPATKVRPRQPVTAVAEALGEIVKVPVFTKLLHKAKSEKALKDMDSKADKIEALGDSFSVKDEITNEGKWNVLLVDDLYDTGASMEAACKVLAAYEKVNKIYVASLTWKKPK